MEEDKAFGLLVNSSINIGDEIQSVAAKRFLPRVDKRVHRERINKFKNDKKTKLIMNAWWTRRVWAFPPSDDIEPLLISMHFCSSFRKYNKGVLPKEYKDYLIKYGPVGCRDTSTVKYLESQGVPAYFSGCMTLTLQANPTVEKKNYILCVDVDKEILEEIKKRTNRPVFNITRKLLPLKVKNRFHLANAMLRIYQSAHCVVTSRVHVSMPCLALGTPVLMLNPKDNLVKKNIRFGGLKELCHQVDADEFLNNPNVWDFENPPANPDDYKKLREDLIKRCSEFTGYNNEESMINNDEPIEIELIKCFKYDFKVPKRLAYFLEPKKILTLFWHRIVLKRDAFDI